MNLSLTHLEDEEEKASFSENSNTLSHVVPTVLDSPWRVFHFHLNSSSHSAS